MQFFFSFVGLTFAELVVVWGVLKLLALYYSKRPIDADDKRTPEEHFRSMVWNNNVWWCVGVGMVVVTGAIALYKEFGPALWLPKDHPTPETRAWFQDVLNYFFSTTSQPKTPTPTDPLPWATGTWFWCKATGLYFLITLLCTPITFWDEFTHGCKAVATVVQKYLEKREHPPGRKEPATTATKETPSGLKIFSWSFLADAAGAFFFTFLDHWKNRK